MKAAVVKAFDQPLVIEERPVREPGPGQVLIRLEASGLCGTDVRLVRGDWPVRPDPPYVPGHEGAGVVIRTGADVTDRRAGERVAVGWLGWACGACRYCLTGQETLCPRQRNTSLGTDGLHAEYAVAEAAFCVPVPADLDPLDAAPLACAGVTAHRAVRTAGVRTGDLVAVVGIGGDGHLAVQYAEVAGGTIIAVDVDDDKLEVARDLGAAHTVNARRSDPVRYLRELGGAHAAIVAAPDARAAEQAYESLRPGGRLTLVALPHDDTMTVPILRTALRGISVRGAGAGSRADVADVFALHAAGRATLIRHRYRLPDVNDAIGELGAGRAIGRVVFDLRS
ncbi:alcohol dehydrogenase catalytic domain-containing protein [Actinocatenispora rupis]|uniref:Alcohol dehydrogenase n=1 Tax=Actinocatenispora rupis TaxID=519421 RepID=A0A8J3JGN5_9ACTN|nr:zinc-dependent alcohol dehydrogenase [Actinocatenispora rupis]GID15568.1 zinc-dependent alcohol dehydrogenase [Actinocatenispora rupis]